MNARCARDCFERSPIIAAIRDSEWEAALDSPSEVLFLLKANLMTVRSRVEEAHAKGKYVLIHIDLADGIGKDEVGIGFLAACGADGIISTRGSLIRHAKDLGLVTVQRFFVLDSQGVVSAEHALENLRPDFVEILPGIAEKVIRRFADRGHLLIAGGLIETKQEVTAALSCGAIAVSTGRQELWNLI